MSDVGKSGEDTIPDKFFARSSSPKKEERRLKEKNTMPAYSGIVLNIVIR
jgi:hypothetical protein